MKVFYLILMQLCDANGLQLRHKSYHRQLWRIEFSFGSWHHHSLATSQVCEKLTQSGAWSPVYPISYALTPDGF